MPVLRSFLRAAALAAATVLLAHPAFAQGTGRREITGTVRDVGGAPVPSAEVRVTGTQIRVLSDVNGVFIIRNAPDAADVRLIVRRLGFRPAAVDVALAGDQTTDVFVQLEPTPTQLAPVIVAARPEVFEQRLSGFYARMNTSIGHYIKPERLQNLTSHRFSDIIREVPGTRILASGGNVFTRSIRLRGANCAPLVFVDGMPANSGEFDVDMIEPSTIEGVEIYHGMATIPAQFASGAGGDRCGVIAFWSRPYRAPARTVEQPQVNVAELAASNSVFTAETVDLAATPKPRAIVPVYPDSLWKERVSGRVLLEFIVDTLGRVEPGTLGVVTTSHELFARAAMDAVALGSFHAAYKAGRPVRQIVQLPIIFEPATEQKP